MRQTKAPFPPMPPCCTGEDRFRFLNEERLFTTWNDPECNRLWLYNLHYFDWLRQEGMTREDGDSWIAKWIAENPAPAGCGWEPYPLSLRIVNWVKWHMSGHPLSDEAKQSLAVQVRFLMRRLEYHLLANHLIANAKALVFAGCSFSGPEAEKWLAKGLEIYRQQLPEQILADGGHFERSPMYHSIILEDLLDLKNIGAPLDSDGYISRMLHWLAVMTGPDGEISFFNDAARGIALSPEKTQRYAQSLGFGPERIAASEDLPSSGYSRLQQGDAVCLCDTGEIGPAYQPGHVHADALSFELWLKGKKVLTNCGTGRYHNSTERAFQRSSAAHNTLSIDGQNSSEVWSAHRVARRGKLLARSMEQNRCSGTFRTWKGMVCTRTWEMMEDGRLMIRVHVHGRGQHELALYFHEPEAPQLEITSDPAGEIQTGSGIFSPEFGIFEKSALTKEVYGFCDEINIQTIITERKK